MVPEPEPDFDERWTNTGDPYAGYRDVERVPTIPVVRIMEGLRRRLAAGEITNEQFIEQTQQLLTRVEAANQQRARNREIRAAQGRERGADIVREKLLAGRRRGELDYHTVEFALWLLNNNPQLANGLAASVVAGNNAPRNILGSYFPTGQLIRLFKNRASEDYDTAVHEILHHAERMMPPDVQAGIRNEYNRAFAKALADHLRQASKLSDAAIKSGTVTNEQLNEFVNQLSTYRVDEYRNYVDTFKIPADLAQAIIRANLMELMGVAQTGDPIAQEQVMRAFSTGLLPTS
jgi:hypothetical protein